MLDYQALLRGVKLFHEQWGDEDYLGLILGRRDVWENLENISVEDTKGNCNRVSQEMED
jgi:hypothetical protein